MENSRLRWSTREWNEPGIITVNRSALKVAYRSRGVIPSQDFDSTNDEGLGDDVLRIDCIPESVGHKFEEVSEKAKV